MFKQLLVVALSLSPALAALCSVAGLPAGIPAGTSYPVTQLSNALSSGLVSNNVLAGSITIIDSCTFSANITFSFKSTNNTDPALHWYGYVTSPTSAFPIVDAPINGTFSAAAAGVYSGQFSQSGSVFKLTNQGATVGGVDFSMIGTIVIYSSAYQWAAGSVTLPLSQTTPTNKNGPSPTATNGGISTHGSISALLLVAFVAMLF